MGQDLLDKDVFFLVTHVTSFFLDMALEGLIARVDEGSIFLDRDVFCLNLFE